jgi:hypothetical protein
MHGLRWTAILLLSATLLILTVPRTLAEGAVTETTNEHNITETIVDILPCVGNGEELFEITTTTNVIEHSTFAPNGSMHFTFTQTGDFSAVPISDPSLPSFSGHFTIWSGFNGNNKNATGTFTFTIKGVGSDGSRVDFHETAHFTLNANGVPTVEFDKISC